MSDDDAAALREFLSTRDAACPACRYSLRGLITPRCPECNQPLVLRVGLAEPLGLGYVLSLIGLTIGFGAALLFVTGVVIISLVEKDFPRGPESVGLLWYPAFMAALLGLPILLLAGRRGRLWFGRRLSAKRRLLAWTAWGATLGCFAVWVVLLVRLF